MHVRDKEGLISLPELVRKDRSCRSVRYVMVLELSSTGSPQRRKLALTRNQLGKSHISTCHSVMLPVSFRRGSRVTLSRAHETEGYNG